MQNQFYSQNPTHVFNLKVIKCLRQARRRFFTSFIERVDANQLADMPIIQSDATFYVAEFYYRLRAFDIKAVEDLKAFALQHNERIAKTISSQQKFCRSRTRLLRIERAIFSTDVMGRLLQNWREHPGAMDQSNLARFLALEMSTESCRKVILALSEMACFERLPTPYGTTLVISNGWLEDMFEDAIGSFREGMDVRDACGGLPVMSNAELI